YGLQTFTSDKQVVQDVDIVILSMKPADIEAAIASIKPYLTENHLLISVAAGVEIEAIESYVGFNIPVIRTMTNTSASVGLSATAICGGRFVTDDDLTLTEQLFQTIGITEVVAEDDIHAVTGLSGSGPAYVYYLVEAMEKAAVEVGLSQEVATSFARQTIIGAGEMLKKSNDSAKTLKENVMSPGGTTEAGIKTLQNNHFEETISACIQRAKERSIELGK